MDANFIEVSVIGSILIDPRCLTFLREQITADMFLDEQCRAVFEAACSLQDNGQAVDPVVVAGKLPQVERKFILETMDLTPTSANATVYAGEMRKEWMRRQAYDALREAQGDLLGQQDPMAVTAEVIQMLRQITDGEAQKGLVTAQDAAMSLFNRWQAADEGETFVIPTGYAGLDKLLGGGMIRGGLYIAAARPGCGKTTFGQNIAERVQKAGKRVLFVSLEMSVEELEARRLSMKDGRHTAFSLLRRDFPDVDYDGLTPQLLAQGKSSLYYLTRRNIGVSDVQFFSRHISAELVIVDYLGLLRYEPGKSLYESVTKTSNRLKQAAMGLNVATF